MENTNYQQNVHRIEVWKQQNLMAYDKNMKMLEDKYPRVDKLDKDWVVKETDRQYKIYKDMEELIYRACKVSMLNILQYNFLELDVSKTLTNYKNRVNLFNVADRRQRSQWVQAHKDLKILQVKIKSNRKELEDNNK